MRSRPPLIPAVLPGLVLAGTASAPTAGVGRKSTEPAYAARIEMTLTEVEDLLAVIDSPKDA